MYWHAIPKHATVEYKVHYEIGWAYIVNCLICQCYQGIISICPSYMSLYFPVVWCKKLIPGCPRCCVELFNEKSNLQYASILGP